MTSKKNILEKIDKEIALIQNLIDKSPKDIANLNKQQN